MDDVDLTESRQRNLRSLIIAMTVLSTTIICVRFWSRYLSSSYSVTRISYRFWWDDWTALAAAASNVAVCGIGFRIIDLGLGKHIQVVPPENLEPFAKLLWIEYFIFDAGTTIARTSALFFYARVFGEINDRFRYALWVVHIVNVVWLIGSIVGVAMECTPIEKVWKPLIEGKCIDMQTYWIATAALSLLIDVIILMMPLQMLWKLQMKTIRKIQVTIVFLCGFMVVVVTVGRLVTIVQAGDKLLLDPTWQLTDPILWLSSEIAISVVGVSLPSLLFLVQRGVRDGAWALITPGGTVNTRRFTTDPGSKSRLNSLHDHPYFRKDDGIESGNPSIEYPTAKIPLKSNVASRIITIGQSSKAEYCPDDREQTPPSGIQVRSDIIIS